MPYYKRIRELREDHDMTQNDVAEYLGMKQPQYFRYENGNRDVPTEVLISCKIVQSFNRLHFRIKKQHKMIFFCILHII